MYEDVFADFGTDLEACTEAYEKLAEAMRGIRQMFDETARIMQQIFKELAELAEDFYEEPMTLREYGMSLLNRKKYTNDRLS